MAMPRATVDKRRIARKEEDFDIVIVSKQFQSEANRDGEAGLRNGRATLRSPFERRSAPKRR
jgi:hypothetical protein